MERTRLVVRLISTPDLEARCRYVLSQASRFLAAEWLVIDAASPEEADITLCYGRFPSPRAAEESPTLTVPRGPENQAALPRRLLMLSGDDSHLRVPILESSRCLDVRVEKPLYLYPAGAAAIGYSSRREITFGYDLIGMLFSLLSCEREYFLEKNGVGINSLFRNLHEPADVFTSPIVNQNILLLKSLLAELDIAVPAGEGERSPYPGGKTFAICLTHDVDYIKKTLLQRVKHLRHGTFRAIRSARTGKWIEGGREMASLMPRCFGDGDYWCFRKIRDLETRFEAASTFNFYSRAVPLTPGGILRDPWYNIGAGGDVKAILREIEDWGGEVALHGSYDSCRKEELLARERRELEAAAKTEVAGGRQHFLNFSIPGTWLIQEKAGLRYDSTYGFRDLAGFRNGAAFPFQPFDLGTLRPINLLEIPLVLMDGVLFDRDYSGEEGVWPKVVKVLQALKDHRGAASICWHQRVFYEQDFPGWAGLYERIMKWVRENDGWMGPCRDLVKHWET